ncbi:MAG: hypothetical protein Q4A32_06720 [Lachnospiraceae bacterium]|nr:hypothetical protein [Lachnospiraceae bacterium]
MDSTIRITRDENGIWHWIYRLPMFRDFSILRTVIKAMEAVYAVMFLFSIVIIYINGSTLSRSRGFILIMLGVGVLILLLSVVCYFGVAAIFGGYYIFVYTMDENALSVTQPVGQANKTKAIGMFAATAGTLNNNPGVTVAGLAAGGSQIAYTKFEDILSLKFDRKGGEIRIHSFMTWYSIYVHPEDFAFVEEFMTNRCTKARVTVL